MFLVLYALVVPLVDAGEDLFDDEVGGLFGGSGGSGGSGGFGMFL